MTAKRITTHAYRLAIWNTMIPLMAPWNTIGCVLEIKDECKRNQK